MSIGFVDLHAHSTASDGTLPPEDVVRLAARSGLAGLALTDHDTVDGVHAAAAEAARLGLQFIPAIEISAAFPRPGTLHLLGYGVDPQTHALAELSRRQIDSRNQRNPRILSRLSELGVAIDMAEVQQEAGGQVVGRPHIARILLRKGYVSSVKHAFEKYLGQGGLAYFDRDRLAPREAIAMIRAAGGLAVLAHPVQLRTENDAQLERIVKDLADIGLEGVEVIHSDHTAELVECYTRLAGRLGLIRTGGSDFHGDAKHGIQLGLANGRRIPRSFMDDLLGRLRAAQHSAGVRE